MDPVTHIKKALDRANFPTVISDLVCGYADGFCIAPDLVEYGKPIEAKGRTLVTFKKELKKLCRIPLRRKDYHYSNREETAPPMLCCNEEGQTFINVPSRGVSKYPGGSDKRWLNRLHDAASGTSIKHIACNAKYLFVHARSLWVCSIEDGRRMYSIDYRMSFRDIRGMTTIGDTLYILDTWHIMAFSIGDAQAIEVAEFKTKNYKCEHTLKTYRGNIEAHRNELYVTFNYKSFAYTTNSSGVLVYGTDGALLRAIDMNYGGPITTTVCDGKIAVQIYRKNKRCPDPHCEIVVVDAHTGRHLCDLDWKKGAIHMCSSKNRLFVLDDKTIDVYW
jgi:hypothetical protein